MSKDAKDWALSLARLLPRVAFQVLEKRAELAGGAHMSWLSQPEISRRTRNSLRAVKYADEWLVAHGVLIVDGWQWTANQSYARGGVLTRRYRLPVGEPLEHLVAASSPTVFRSARGALLKQEKPAFRSARRAPLKSDRPAFRSAPRALLNGAPTAGLEVHQASFRSAPGALNRSNTKILDGGREGDPLTPARPPLKNLATAIESVAAREAGDNVRQLTAAELAATLERRARALTRKPSNWWDVLPVELTTAADRPNRPAHDRRDWRRGAKT